MAVVAILIILGQKRRQFPARAIKRVLVLMGVDDKVVRRGWSLYGSNRLVYQFICSESLDDSNYLSYSFRNYTQQVDSQRTRKPRCGGERNVITTELEMDIHPTISKIFGYKNPVKVLYGWNPEGGTYPLRTCVNPYIRRTP